METFIRGIATFLATTVLGVVHFFYKPPAPPVTQPGNEPIPATSTLPSSLSPTSSVSTGPIATTTKSVMPAPVSTVYPSVPTSPAKSGVSPSVIEMPVPTPSNVSYGMGIATSSTSGKSLSVPAKGSTPLVTDMTPSTPSVPFVPYPTSSVPMNSNLGTPITAIGNYLVKNLSIPMPFDTTPTPSGPSTLPVPYTPQVATSSFVNLPPPPIPASSGSAQPTQTSGSSTVSTSTIISQQIAALSGLPLSTPQKQEPLNTTGPEMYKVFNFAVSANSFTPGAIIVQQGDLAQLNITSSINTTLESKDLQFSVPITSGGVSAVSIPASNLGTFVFYATGSNSQTIFGYFVVRARI